MKCSDGTNSKLSKGYLLCFLFKEAKGGCVTSYQGSREKTKQNNKTRNPRSERFLTGGDVKVTTRVPVQGDLNITLCGRTKKNPSRLKQVRKL